MIVPGMDRISRREIMGWEEQKKALRPRMKLKTWKHVNRNSNP